MAPGAPYDGAMTEVPAPRYRAGDADRDAALEILQRAYEAGRLTFTDMQERQDRALSCVYTDELRPLVADLPEGDELGERPGATVLVPRRSVVPETAPAHGGASLTVMSGRDVVVESGTRDLSDFAWWGGNNYDLSEAMGPGRVVTLHLHAVMAGHNLYVPEGVRVIDQSVAIMAGNDIDRFAQGDGSNGTLILKGVLFWAGSDVKLAGDR